MNTKKKRKKEKKRKDNEYFFYYNYNHKEIINQNKYLGVVFISDGKMKFSAEQL